MSDDKRQLRLLRQMINETVKMRVLAQYVDVEGKKEKAAGDVIEVFIDNPDDADELNFILNKYGRPTPEFLPSRKAPIKTDPKRRLGARLKTQQVPGSKERVPTEANRQVFEVAHDLVGNDASRLLDVIAPWGQSGWDAMRRIWKVSDRYPNNPFPFFSTTPVLGASAEFPTAPSLRIVDEISNKRPPVGGLSTGRGELLFALMTGGIAGGDEGDITIGSEVWEMKDITEKSIFRLGEKTSFRFLDYFKDEKNLSAVQKVVESLKLKGGVDELLTKLSKRDGTEALLQNGEVKNVVEDAWRDASAPIHGFVLIEKNVFHFVDPDDLVLAYIGSNDRLFMKRK